MYLQAIQEDLGGILNLESFFPLDYFGLGLFRQIITTAKYHKDIIALTFLITIIPITIISINKMV